LRRCCGALVYAERHPLQLTRGWSRKASLHELAAGLTLISRFVSLYIIFDNRIRGFLIRLQRYFCLGIALSSLSWREC